MRSEVPNLDIFQSLVAPWYDSLKNPSDTQENVLLELLNGYRKTRYGKDHNAFHIKDSESFRSNFPVIDYQALNPYLAEVRKGDYLAILPEPLVCWVMTRGSTGHAKVLPVTRRHLEQILACGARALINHAMREKNFDLFDGRILNLNFPSNVHTVTIGNRSTTYGYSSGTYARLNPVLGKTGLRPRQEEIDALGSGITRRDWERRFEFVYKQALNENINSVMGVTPVILSFARYVKEKYGKEPRELWKFRALFCTSVRKIQFKYAPVLKKYFGEVPVVEIYSATEGVFAQQLDDLPYVVPNYDSYFFEVKSGHGTKMLHEMKRGEWGRLIISSCMFPRYDIGDMIEAAGNNYFRVFGRRKTLTILEHRLYRLFFGHFL